MPISRAQEMKQLVPGLNIIFGTTYETYDAEHVQFYDTSNSERAFEEDLKESGLGLAAVKAEGAPIVYDNGMQEVFVARYDHSAIALGFQVTEEAVEDNLYEDVATKGARGLAKSLAVTKQIRAMDLINRGFTTYTGPDGVTLFATNHPTVAGRTNANRPVTPVDLNETSLEAADIGIAGWVDERGLPIRVMAQQLVVPKALQTTAQRILGSALRSGTADNDTNALRDLRLVPNGTAVNHYLTDPNAWFLRTSLDVGLRHFVRRAYRFEKDGDFDTGNFKFKATERYSFGTTDPLGVYGSPGST